jgi:hypothetical protein
MKHGKLSELLDARAPLQIHALCNRLIAVLTYFRGKAQNFFSPLEALPVSFYIFHGIIILSTMNETLMHVNNLTGLAYRRLYDRPFVALKGFRILCFV